jgi:hypothetical protein
MNTQIYSYLAGRFEAALRSLPLELFSKDIIDKHLQATIADHIGHTIHEIKNDPWLMHVLYTNSPRTKE